MVEVVDMPERDYTNEIAAIAEIAKPVIEDNPGSDPLVLALVIASNVVTKFPFLRLGPSE